MADPVAGWLLLLPMRSLACEAVQQLQSLRAVDGAPEPVDLHALQALLESWPGVLRVRDPHVWPRGTSACCHDGTPGDAAGPRSTMIS